MVELTLLEVANAVRGELSGCGDIKIVNVVTDSRKVRKDFLFIALVGDKFDGHNFIQNAFSSGAAAVISDRYIDVPCGKAVIVVRDTKKALLELAAYYREQFHIPIVAVTGSVGKTTTKEFIYSVLSRGYKTVKTIGNFNNDIGLPLTTFTIERETQAAVLEMGMSGFGEIETLTNIARPYIGVITNIGTAHIENLGSRDGILKAKMEIVKGIAPNGYLVLNIDEPLLEEARTKRDINIIYYGIDNKNGDFYAENIREFSDYTFFEIKGKINKEVRIPTVGRHNVYNAICAAAVGYLLGIGQEKMAEGLLCFENAKMRQNIYEKNGVTIIDDCYNANPDSMKAAIKVLANRQGRKVAILGDMLELGVYSEIAHSEIGAVARQNNVDLLVCFGSESRFTLEAFLKNKESFQQGARFSSKEHLSMFLRCIVKKGDTLLFKGSRGMKMEEIIQMYFKD